MDGLNECRTARVAEILADFRTLQFYIVSAPDQPLNSADCYTAGWTVLRQSAVAGHDILDFVADTTVPVTEGGEQEQNKAELKQVHLDAFSRRHQGQKIYLRQCAAIQWLKNRDLILQGQRTYPAILSRLHACDMKLDEDLAIISDEYVYAQLASSDRSAGRWTVEDPSLRSVQRWLRVRQR